MFKNLRKGLQVFYEFGSVDECELGNIPKTFDDGTPRTSHDNYLRIAITYPLESENEQTLIDLGWTRQDDGYEWVYYA